MEIVQAVKKLIQSRESDWTFGDGRFCVQLCIETPYKQASSVAHLTNFSFEFSYKIFTEDAPLPLLYHGAKSQEWPKTQIKEGGPALIPKTIGNRKRDCAWGCARGINTTWENLQIEKHKPGRRSFHSPDWFVLFDLKICSGGVYSPSATSRTISFSISNSFWY